MDDKRFCPFTGQECGYEKCMGFYSNNRTDAHECSLTIIARALLDIANNGR